MPLDHYVSQTHLEKFYSPILGKRMYGRKKTDGKKFPCDSKSVCRIMNGNSNAYLLDERAIEYFLKEIEPKYNIGLQQAANHKLDAEGLLGIVGFAVYVAACSPTAMRLGTGPLRMALEASAKLAREMGHFPDLPPALRIGRVKNIADAIDTGVLHFKVDPKYPQAIGIGSFLQRVSRWGNCQLNVIFNEFEDSPFFTSDFPVALQPSGDPAVIDRIVPLSPLVALWIRPDISRREAREDLTFSDARIRYEKASRDKVRLMNTQIVRSAEDLVFYRDDRDWVDGFISRNADYWIGADEVKDKTASGYLLRPRMVIQRRPK